MVSVAVPRIIPVEAVGTADVTDALSGSRLDPIPGVGAVAIWLRSVASTDLFTLSVDGVEQAVNGVVTIVTDPSANTGAGISDDAQPDFLFQVTRDTKIRLDINNVSGANVRFRVVYAGQ